MKISFVVAVYHNEGALSKTHEKIQAVFLNELAHYEYEIVFVDDGSKDGSLRELLSLRHCSRIQSEPEPLDDFLVRSSAAEVANPRWDQRRPTQVIDTRD